MTSAAQFASPASWECRAGPSTVGRPIPGGFSCPEFYRLPTGGSQGGGARSDADAVHVFEGLTAGDMYWVGAASTTAAGDPRFHPAPRLPGSGGYQRKYLYHGSNAGKSFWDTHSSRRLLWTWLSGGASGGCDVAAAAAAPTALPVGPDVPARGHRHGHGRPRPRPRRPVPCNSSLHAWDGVMSVPLQVTYAAEHRQLAISPVAELAQLRRGAAGGFSGRHLLAGGNQAARSVLPAGAGTAHMDIVANFQLTPALAAMGNCSVGLRLYGTGRSDSLAIEMRLVLGAGGRAAGELVLSPGAGLHAGGAQASPLPATLDLSQPLALRVLADGGQIEVFAAGGLTNTALRCAPDLSATADNVVAAVADCPADVAVEASVQVHTMGTAYE